MDFTILYAIAIIIGVLGAIFGIQYLRKKNILKIDINDILFVVTMFNLSMEVIDELNLKQEPMIKKIGDILEDTMNFIADNYDDKADMNSIAFDYAINLAEKVGLELTEQRKEIIKKLIDIGLQTKF